MEFTILSGSGRRSLPRIVAKLAVLLLDVDVLLAADSDAAGGGTSFLAPTVVVRQRRMVMRRERRDDFDSLGIIIVW